MFSVTKKELHQFFGGLTGYITIALFLLINGIFLFILKDSNLLDFGYATLDRFFDLAPWIFLFLIPALTMRTLSDEFKAGTFEILRTRPLNGWQIIFGKYVAILAVLIVTLVPTFVYVYTVRSLAVDHAIDSGGITGSYIGLFLLGAVFAAIGICCSGFTSNTVIAFLFSSFACLTLFFGFKAISKLALFRGQGDYYIEMLGIDSHYTSVGRGLLDSRDVVYFLSLIFLSLLITEKNLSRR